jgi:hypothetical protein
MSECFKMGMGYFEMSKELGRRDGRCVRSIGELVPVWLGMLGVVHLVVKDRVA